MHSDKTVIPVRLLHSQAMGLQERHKDLLLSTNHVKEMDISGVANSPLLRTREKTHQPDDLPDYLAALV